jgi:hypothetical protein
MTVWWLESKERELIGHKCRHQSISHNLQHTESKRAPDVLITMIEQTEESTRRLDHSDRAYRERVKAQGKGRVVDLQWMREGDKNGGVSMLSHNRQHKKN